MFKLFADLIAFHLESRTSAWRRARRRCSTARQSAELREQFIAVLGHDLRNPLASIDAGVRMLAKSALDEKARHVAALIDAASRAWRA